MSSDTFYALRDNLRVLHTLLPSLYSEATGNDVPEAAAWRTQLERHVLPALDFDLPVLLVAISGGGSTGKSTLLNALAHKEVSKVGFRAGLTLRVLLVGHPSVLSSEQVARALLHRLPEPPVPWRSPTDTLRPGPPLYVASDDISPNLMLMDTPDFDTGSEGRLVNRQRAEPVLRTAEVLLYLFTNTVYNNLSNTRFMADVIGGIGGRPTILIYRISRAASDGEALAHCTVVAENLYGRQPDGGFPPQVVGVYRMHESDQVAEGRADPTLVPLGASSAGQSLERLLAGLDVAAVKRHAFAADLRAVRAGAHRELDLIRQQAAQAGLYRQALRQVMAQEALGALQAFPVDEALALTARLFAETSPSHVRVLRAAGQVVAAPLRAAQYLGRRLSEWTGAAEPQAPPPDLETVISRELLLGANRLRNRLVDDTLIVQVGEDDALLEAARLLDNDRPLLLERVNATTQNLHVPVPQALQRLEPAMLDQRWAEVEGSLRSVAREMVGLPAAIEEELRTSVAAFRARMGWRERLRETFFASLTALPPLLGVTYTLLTADPVTGTGLWIRLQGVLGMNDLWALVSIPASAGLSEQDRKQLQLMIEPVFKLWLEHRLETAVAAYERTIAAPLLEGLDAIPMLEDPRLDAVKRALRALEEAA